MELQEQFPIVTDVKQLEHVGFSSEQIAGLLRVKALYQQGAYHEDEPSHKRQEFIRWLYLQGRLQAHDKSGLYLRGRHAEASVPR